MQQTKEYYLKMYFQVQPEYYFRFYKQYRQGRRISFNLAAFLAAPFWLLHRKMYGEFVLVLLIIFALGIANGFATIILEMEESLIDPITDLPKALIFMYYGFYGNLLYVRRASVRVNNIMAIVDLKKREKILKNTGGTGPWGFMVALLCLMLLAMRTVSG